MYQLAILDLDGTLVNSVADLAEAVNHSLMEMHYPTHPLDAYYHFVGNGVKKLCERALPTTALPEQSQELLDRFYAYYEIHCMDHTRPYEGMPEALNTLHEQGVQLAVASNKPQHFTETIVTHFFGINRFAVILGSSETRPRKPEPNIIREILTTCNITPEQAVMIGDSNVDIETARNADIASIGCTWGFRGRKELEQAGAVRIAEFPSDLTSLVL